MSSIMVVGSMAFDSIETPFGKAPKILGGSANYFALSASNFARVQCVSVVGEDYPQEQIELLKSKKVDVSGVRIEAGKTFHWSGSYGFDLNEARTLSTHLNVFEKFEPVVPTEFRTSPYVFLGNLSPVLQMKVLAQMQSPKFVAIDTMNFWIEGQRDSLIEAISKCNCLIINEGEIRQLTKNHNIVLAAKQVQAWGPQIVVIKRGEYGATLFHDSDMFAIPGLPLSEVKDPTGAGDTFAGGFMGYLASQPELKLDARALRRAVVHGCIMASFTVQDFGFQALTGVTGEKIKERYSRFVELTTFHD
jgi:sugar/nucleoside kinase (ribokinase family)